MKDAPTQPEKARLDASGTAKPRTEIVGHFPPGKKPFLHNAESLELRATNRRGHCDECGKTFPSLDTLRVSMSPNDLNDYCVESVTISFRCRCGVSYSGTRRIAEQQT